ncbi:MAG: DUF2723 domain-containing protein [Bacteroidota bacterium]|nr:DUF2723 domain-containing protein [Bacteroidota bacterium]
MKSYKFLNNIFGWVAFLVSAVVYLLTIEPTASFWDCPEFITTASKLEVGHPPGDPFFMILGRFFTLLTSNPAHNAMMVNTMSALASAFTIMFLFWTITHLAKRLVVKDNAEPNTKQLISILGSGLVGALAYTFSDTFWFSAVEAEVYGTSSLITALVFWAILKWENVADEKYANRWIVFIAFLIGISIGVHLLNLLAIPAIVFVYYYRKYEVTRKGLLWTSLISVVILGAILYGIIPGVFKIASFFEILFVNSFGLPYNSGLLFFVILLIAGIVWGVRYTLKNKMPIWNTIIICFTVIMIGYSAYAMTLIRANANLPMNQNNPDDTYSLLYYLNREQYGDRPLITGQYYNSPLDSQQPYSKDKTIYTQKDGKYVVADERQVPNYDSNFTTLFPRMWSNDPKHIQEYKKWANIKGNKISHTGPDGQNEVLEIPTFSENLSFFFKYQLGHMYMRYFMWNFSGRQNDIQGQGDILSGNWISGINALDSFRLGSQDNLPAKYKDNPGRNKYFLLPLILGLLGLIFQFNASQKGRRDLWVVFLLFFMTGIAIVLYLNQSPLQPRERDYAYAGSFYAFTIWIGLGVLAIIEALKKVAPGVAAPIIATVLSLVMVPGIMAQQNWDDHNRSKRYMCRDFGVDYLESCAPNAVIFTNGDNDTFPLWYAQEVEGIRTDVRVCNLSYLQTDWYIDQMKRKAYKSEPLPFSLTRDQYLEGKREVVYLLDDERIKGAVSLKEAINFVLSDNPSTKLPQADNASFLPTRNFALGIDKKAVIASGIVSAKDSAKIVDNMLIMLPKRQYITKDELLLLDLLANSNWKRPLYFAITVGNDKYLGLDRYFRTEGFAYRVIPVDAGAKDEYAVGSVNTDVMYKNLMEKFKWGNMNSPKVYLDENHRRMAANVRNSFDRLADALVTEGKNDKAVKVLDRCIELVPSSKVPHDFFSVRLAESYFKAGANSKGDAFTRQIFNDLSQELEYYLSLQPRLVRTIDEEIQTNMYLLREMGIFTAKYKQDKLSADIMKKFEQYYKIYASI